MADKKTCGEFSRRLSSTGYCPKPAKFICLIHWHSYGGEKLTFHGYRCGIHAKRYQKIEEIKNG